MFDAFSEKIHKVISCQPPYSFYRLIDRIAICDTKKKNVTADKPMHRFCSLMRKMNARSFVYEKLEPNQELGA